MVTRAVGSAGLKETLVSGLNSESGLPLLKSTGMGLSHTSAWGL